MTDGCRTACPAIPSRRSFSEGGSSKSDGGGLSVFRGRVIRTGGVLFLCGLRVVETDAVGGGGKVVELFEDAVEVAEVAKAGVECDGEDFVVRIL
jgi:hypothetical protein